MNFFSGFCLLILLQSTQVLNDDKLKVSIYYEALCPDSFDFLIRQLCPAYKKIGPSLNVHFIPYGRTTETFEKGEWKFSCQHGPDECWANKIQACGMAQEKGQDANVAFVCCIMNNYHQSASTDHIKSCVHHLNVTNEMLLNCANSSVGENLILSYGNETRSLYDLDFVPTIIFNDNVNESLSNQNAILRSFYNTSLEYLNRHHISAGNDSFVSIPVIVLQFLALCTFKMVMQ